MYLELSFTEIINNTDHLMNTFYGPDVVLDALHTFALKCICVYNHPLYILCLIFIISVFGMVLFVFYKRRN